MHSNSRDEIHLVRFVFPPADKTQVVTLRSSFSLSLSLSFSFSPVYLHTLRVKRLLGYYFCSILRHHWATGNSHVGFKSKRIIVYSLSLVPARLVVLFEVRRPTLRVCTNSTLIIAIIKLLPCLVTLRWGLYGQSWESLLLREIFV